MSTLAILAISIGYGLGALVAGCRCAVLLAWWMYKDCDYSWKGDGPSGDQWFGSGLVGCLAGLIWPLVFLVWCFRSWLLAPPREIREKRQKQRIEELERELGL